MALSYRPITPKQPKVKNKQFRQLYKSENPNCEVCLLNREYTSIIELHHILPMTRLDLRWNVISLCPRHHMEATEHVNGASAHRFNMMLFAIKFLKNEISATKLLELQVSEEVEFWYNNLKTKWKYHSKGELI